MSKSTVLFALVLAAASASIAPAAADPPEFKFSELPPPAPPPAQPLSLYDVFVTGDVSPLGVQAALVKPADLFDKAATFVPSSGRAGNPGEAAYWLKRAVAVAPDDTGKRRAWAISTLALLLYQNGDPASRAAAHNLWELAGAWGSPAALCNLGELAEAGDDVAVADRQKAVEWYQRAKAANCPEAAAALTRLKP